VSCRCRYVTSLAGCRSAFRSEPLSWSKAEQLPRMAKMMSNCGYFPDLSCCRVAAASISAAIQPGSFATGVPVTAKTPRPGGRRGRKKYLTSAEQPSGNVVNDRRRAKPPSPSPSITRRRTPAALAVGVHLFGAALKHECRTPYRSGTAAFIPGRPPDRRGGPLRPGRKSQGWRRYRWRIGRVSSARPRHRKRRGRARSPRRRDRG
jgi:hypothetical protein